MIEYHKIETVYKRDEEGSKKLMEDVWRSKTLEYLKNNEFVFTEKVDGTNISVEWDGHEITFHGRTDKAQIPSHLLEYLENTFSGNENEEIFEQLFGEDSFILYGEGYGNKIQKAGSKYCPDGSVNFILFDIYACKSRVWLDRSSVEEIAKAFNVKVVPEVFRGTINEAIEYIKSDPLSVIGEERLPMEGVVGRPPIELKDKCGNRIIFKLKVKDFRE